MLAPLGQRTSNEIVVEPLIAWLEVAMRRTSHPVAVIVVVVSAIALHAQTSGPRFEVASFKSANDAGWFETRPTRSPEYFKWTSQLGYLVAYAYDIEQTSISGDRSTFGEIYEVNAKTDVGAVDGDVRMMLRSLLTERLGLRAHVEQKESDVYVLSARERRSPLLKEAPAEAPHSPEAGDTKNAVPQTAEFVEATIPEKSVIAITGRSGTMRQLASTLSRVLQAPVRDQTGLSGKDSFDVKYLARDDPGISLPDLFGALSELGLRLDRRRGTTDVLVVDQVERTPKEN
jgi:uncharacterized protein (TIGR03435 family)